MESSGDLRPSLHHSSTSSDDAHYSIQAISSAKIMARKARRHSLFIPQRNNDDIGTSILAHADFPQARARSLSSLNKTEREPGFDNETAHKIMEEIMSQELAYKTYNAKECPSLSQGIVDEIRSRLSSVFNLTGFKLLCTCHITKRAKNFMHMESGCAWDETRNSILKDSFVDCVFKNTDIVAISSVYCLYCRKVTTTTPSLKPATPHRPLRCTVSEPPRREELEEKWLDPSPARRRAFTD